MTARGVGMLLLVTEDATGCSQAHPMLHLISHISVEATGNIDPGFALVCFGRT